MSYSYYLLIYYYIYYYYINIIILSGPLNYIILLSYSFISTSNIYSYKYNLFFILSISVDYKYNIGIYPDVQYDSSYIYLSIILLLFISFNVIEFYFTYYD